MSLMGSLYIGSSGIQTSQNALNTTAHNMSNVDTRGYTRQIVMQSSKQYRTISVSASAIARQQLGMGVLYAETKTQRDVFLDKAFRKESGRSAFYEVSTTALEEVENLLQELDGEDFATALKNLWSAVQDLANEPEQASRQSIFIQRSFEFISRADAVYQGLSDYQDNLNASIKTDIDKINDIGRKIRDLNEAIRVREAAGVERANDMRDARDLLIDELSKLADISYYNDAFGNICIKIEGNDFVKMDSINEIALHADPTNGFYTPYWKALATTKYDIYGEPYVDITGAEVFNLNQTVSTEMSTDVGSVKSKLLARGTHRATYQDIAVSDPNHPEYDLDKAGHYDMNIAQSIIMNMQAEFDQLVNKVVQGINDILSQAAARATANGDPSYMRDSAGNPWQIFEKLAPDGAWSVKNVTINAELRQAPTLLGFILKDNQVDRETTKQLKELFDIQSHTLNPNAQTKVNLAGYYNAMLTQVANSSSVSREITRNQELTVDEISGAREQVIGVSSEEELSNMIMYQNAFNASSRYINVISEMLEHVVTRLGNG